MIDLYLALWRLAWFVLGHLLLPLAGLVLGLVLLVVLVRLLLRRVK